MKKVLILAYDFPPFVSVGGLRPYNWLKYLPEYGVQPIVVTRNWSNDFGNALDYVTASPTKEVEVNREEKGLVIRTPYHPNLSNRLLLKYGANKFRLLRKSLTAWNEITQFIWVTGTKRELYYAAEEYLEDNKVDAIIATGDPFVLFDFARKLGKKYNTPWIADYRDPWSESLNHKELQFMLFWNKRMEKRIVPTAKLITTVSKPVKQIIQKVIPNRNIELLPNGFDPVAMEEANAIAQSSDCLTISYAGSLYAWHPWKSVLSCIEEVILKHKVNIRLKFYGINVEELIRNFLNERSIALNDAVEFIPKLDNESLVCELAKDNVMLLFNDYAIEGTKIFDYIGVKRKILMCYENDREATLLKENYYAIDDTAQDEVLLQKELIEETNAGVVIQDYEDLVLNLNSLLQEFQQNRAIACNSVGVEKYSRKIQVEKLAQLIHQIADKKH